MTSKKITTTQELKQAFAIRKAVFVEEQGVLLADEFDTLEAACEHLLVTYEGQAVGAGRLRVVDDYGKLERICVLKAYRAYGIGKEIVRALEEMARAKGLAKVKLHGQVQAQGFYEKLGYAAASDIFIEDGIPHVVMMKRL